MSMEDRLQTIANVDVQTTVRKNAEYGESWCRRGGHQAFSVIWRKADRIEAMLTQMSNGFDIFDAWERNPGDIRDDIQDLRAYLLLLEEYMTRDAYVGGPRIIRGQTGFGRPEHHPDCMYLVSGHKQERCTCAELDEDSGVPRGRGYVDQD